MKKILLMIVPLMALIGCSYDDTDIQKRLDDLDGQLTELQALVKALNSDVTTLKELVAGKRFISTYSPVKTAATSSRWSPRPARPRRSPSATEKTGLRRSSG